MIQALAVAVQFRQVDNGGSARRCFALQTTFASGPLRSGQTTFASGALRSGQAAFPGGALRSGRAAFARRALRPAFTGQPLRASRTGRALGPNGTSWADRSLRACWSNCSSWADRPLRACWSNCSSWTGRPLGTWTAQAAHHDAGQQGCQKGRCNGPTNRVCSHPLFQLVHVPLCPNRHFRLITALTLPPQEVLGKLRVPQLRVPQMGHVALLKPTFPLEAARQPPVDRRTARLWSRWKVGSYIATFKAADSSA